MSLLTLPEMAVLILRFYAASQLPQLMQYSLLSGFSYYTFAAIFADPLTLG